MQFFFTFTRFIGLRLAVKAYFLAARVDMLTILILKRHSRFRHFVFILILYILVSFSSNYFIDFFL